nr:cupin domain-containing protein [uncultured Cellulosilyticum sp.]
MEGFVEVPHHINFLAKKLFEHIDGEIQDGAIAYLEKQGGGPIENHTHEHNHLFIVIEGGAVIILNQEKVILKQNESYLVKGDIPHSIWNNSDETTVMLGISIR